MNCLDRCLQLHGRVFENEMCWRLSNVLVSYDLQSRFHIRGLGRLAYSQLVQRAKTIDIIKFAALLFGL